MEIILVFTTALLAVVCAQDVAFPGAGEEDPPGKMPPRLMDNRIPVYIPGRCPPNQLLYPGDQKHDWICDCGAGFVYYPAADGCFAVYRKGPCSDDNQILILPKDKVIPECVSNPCRTDGFVRYEGECYELDKSGGPCKATGEGGRTFGVNKTTLALECLKDSTQLLNIIHFPSNCPPGSRRSASNCRPEY